MNLVGETVKLEYYGRGYLLGERTLGADFVPGRQLRRVVGLSERGQVTEQRLGNCVRETGVYDASTGLVMSMTTDRPSPAPAGLPADLSSCPAAGEGSGGYTRIRENGYKYDLFLSS